MQLLTCLRIDFLRIRIGSEFRALATFPIDYDPPLIPSYFEFKIVGFAGQKTPRMLTDAPFLSIFAVPKWVVQEFLPLPKSLLLPTDSYLLSFGPLPSQFVYHN